MLSYARMVVGQGPIKGEFRDRCLPARQRQDLQAAFPVDPPARRRGTGHLERVQALGGSGHHRLGRKGG
jgi:hypothetical protein